ncbi:MAG: dipeptidyl-peptidase 3 family protein [Myxococcales bacterium]|jgi:hypothetical protein
MKVLAQLVTTLALTLAAFPAGAASKSRSPGAAEIGRMMSRFVATPITADLSGLSAGDRRALRKLIEAAKVVDGIFLKQLWSGNEQALADLRGAADDLGKARFEYFWLNKGPWSELDGYTAFLPGVPARKPLGANYYPSDMTREEFFSWFEKLPPERQAQAKGFFSVVRRNEDRRLYVVPYSKEYEPELDVAAGLLREAAALTDNASLKAFLTRRAEAFLSNDYYDSEIAWMELDAPIDVTIGPYETYADELFGFKAAFEAYITIRDDAETARLAALSSHLQEIEDNLPVPPEQRNKKLGALSPIRVVNQVYGAGDAAHGVQAAAFNLPNDERVVQKKGSKRVMLKNVQEAKFSAILKPIAERVLAPGDLAAVSFDAFFMHILAHELSHGLGLHRIDVAGRKTTVRKELAELYSAIEEAKADVVGLFAVQYLIDNAKRLGLGSLFGPNAERELYTTYLASGFRTLRFGIEEAHGKSMAVQLNFLLDRGAVVARADGTFAVDVAKMKKAVRRLSRELIGIEATGNRSAARKLLDELGVLRPQVKKALAKLKDIPTDIRPIFSTADELLAEQEAVR